MNKNNISLIALLISLPTFAAEPQVCPSVDAIKIVGVSPLLVQQADKTWVTGRRNQKYDTNSNWTLIMSRITAASVNEAYDRARQSLTSLTFQLGPVQGPLGKWLCYYGTNTGYTTIAINPPVATNSNNKI